MRSFNVDFTHNKTCTSYTTAPPYLWQETEVRQELFAPSTVEGWQVSCPPLLSVQQVVEGALLVLKGVAYAVVWNIDINRHI